MPNINDSRKAPKVTLSCEERDGFPDADAYLDNLIAAVGVCYERWDPVNNCINRETYSRYFELVLNSALEGGEAQQEIDVPYFSVLVLAFENAFEKCRDLWRSGRHKRFLDSSTLVHYTYTIANKMYTVGMKEAGLLSEREIVVNLVGIQRTLSFHQELIENSLDLAAVFNTLVPVAETCYELLNPGKPGFNEEICVTHFVHSVSCAFQVVQQEHRVGPVDLVGLCSKISIPCIEETLPLLVAAFYKCLPIWTKAGKDFAAFLPGVAHHMLLVGNKLYPAGLKDRGVEGYHDIFDDSGSTSGQLDPIG